MIGDRTGPYYFIEYIYCWSTRNQNRQFDKSQSKGKTAEMCVFRQRNSFVLYAIEFYALFATLNTIRRRIPISLLIQSFG